MGVGLHHWLVSPMLAQPQACRKGLESVTETSVVSWTGVIHVSDKVLEPRLPCAAVGGQDTVAIFALRETGKLPVIGTVDNRLTPWLPGKPAEEHAPHCCV